MDTHVVAEISRFINSYPDAKHIGVLVAGEMAHGDKSKLKSTASIKVGKIDSKQVRR